MVRARGRASRRIVALASLALVVAAAIPFAAPAPARAAAGSLEIWTFSDSGVPTAGVLMQVAVAARSADGSVNSCYNHTVKIDDPGSLVPATVSFSSTNWGLFCTGDQGMKGFTFVPKKAGAHTMTLTDASDPSITGVWNFSVRPGPATQVKLIGDPSAVTGVAAHYTVTLYDSENNVATRSRATIHVSSTDAAATLPADIQQDSSWRDGRRSFSVTFATAGPRSITATDVNHPTRTATVPVTVTTAPKLEVWVQSPVTAGQPASYQVCALKADDTADTTYQGTVVFGMDDPGDFTSTPPNHKFTVGPNGDNGCFIASNYYFQDLVYTTPGEQFLDVTDLSNPAIHGRAYTQVYGAEASRAEILELPATAGAGTYAIQVALFDQYNHPAGSGHITFSSSDPAAVLPAGLQNYTTANDGAKWFNVTLPTVGAQTLTVTSTTVGHAFTKTANVEIVPGPVHHFALSAIPSITKPNVAHAIAVTAVDAYGNRVPTYGGTARATSTDPAAVLPADKTFNSIDAGAYTYLVTFKTDGTRSVTFTDLASPSISGTRGGILVDGTAPTAVAPGLALRSGLSLVGATVPVRVTVPPATDAGSGVAGYQYRLEAASLLASGTSATAPFTYDASAQTTGDLSFIVKATDGAGNATGWYGPSFEARIHQSNWLSAVSGWSAATAAEYSGGSTLTSATPGATATYTFTGRAVGLVTTVGPGRGIVNVYVDGSLVPSSVDTYAATEVNQRIAWTRNWSAVGAHTVRFVVAGTPGRPVVDLDAVVALYSDWTAPTVTTPAASIPSSGALSGTSIPVSVAWTATDNVGGSGIAVRQLGRSTDGGTTWTTPWSGQTSTLTTYAPTTGTVRFRDRAYDKAVNLSGWSAAGPVLSPRLAQTETGVTYTGSWSTSAGASYSGGSLRYASAAGASATYAFTGRSIAIVTTKAASRGSFRVYVDGSSSYTTVSAYAATTAYRQIVWSRTWSSAGSHTVRVVVAGTPGHARVDLDAFALLK